MKQIISAIALALLVSFSASAQDAKGKTKEQIEACKKACEKAGKKCTADAKTDCIKECNESKVCHDTTSKDKKQDNKGACCSQTGDKKKSK
ncbi:MAG: hypothetical protein ACRCVU_06475 [Flavobacterium sp.]